MNRLFITVLLQLFSIACFSQYERTDFGVTTMDELLMEDYAMDTTAKAFYLFDYGHIKFRAFSSGRDYLYTRHLKIKILDTDAADFANFEIPLYQGDYESESIYDLKAQSYNLENGAIKITKLDPKEVYEKDHNKRWVTKKFAVPNIKKGTVIEVSYTITSGFLFKLRSWEFQHKIPVMYSDFEIEICPLYEYKILKYHYLNYSYDTSYVEHSAFDYKGERFDTKVYKVGLENVPAFKDESYLPKVSDYIEKIEFQLSNYIDYYGVSHKVMTTWEELTKEYLKHPDFGAYAKSLSAQAKKDLDELNISTTNQDTVVKILTDHVKASFKWDGQYGEHARIPKNKFLKSKSGNIGAINLFLLALLNEADIEAYPILLSTRSHGKIFPIYPFASFFNYMVVLATVGEKYYLLDATEPNLPFNQLPVRCLNGYGYRIKKKDESLWFPLVDNNGTSTKSLVVWSFDEDKENLTGEFTNKSTGYIAQKFREILLEDGKDALADEILEESEAFEIDSISIENPGVYQPLKTKIYGTAPYDQIGDKLIVPLFIVNEHVKNPFVFEKRDYPVYFKYPFTSKNVVTIVIPEGYKVAKIPNTIRLSCCEGNAEYLFNIVETPFNVQIITDFALRKQEFKVDEYADLKAFFQQIVDLQSEVVIFEKSE